MNTTDIQFIRQQHPFDVLTPDELARIEASATTETIRAGGQILKQGGTPSAYLYLIGEGAVQLIREKVLSQVLDDGDCFGYPSIISGNPPTADAIAEEDTTLYRIPKEVFLELIENAAFSEFFLKNLGERLRHITSGESATIGGELTTPVGNLVVRPPVTVSPAATVAEAAKTMRRAWVDVVLVTDENPGIVTDHDFQVKVLAEDLGPTTPVQQVMTRPLKTLPAETPVYGALMFMLEEHIHHLPVTEEGKITGIVTATDLLRHQTRSPLYMMRQLETMDSPDSISKHSLEIAGMVENLVSGGLDVTQIGRIIASINDVLIRRLLRLAEEEIGRPPAPYAWIVFGSEGRMEQALLTDQDNALVYLESSNSAHQYFQQLAQKVIDYLMLAGFPPCPGGYMATNWCKPIHEWEQTFQRWIRKPEPQNLLETAIFFDFRHVYGGLSVEPLEKLVTESSNDQIFLAQLARAAIEFKPPLGFFRRIRAEEGQVDLKSGGIAPIVSLARVYALEAKSRARTTVERLEAAIEANTVSEQGGETLIETYRFLLQLRLQEQLRAIRAGQLPDNKVRLQSLSPVENRHLKEAFVAIREMQEAAANRFHTGMLG
ncbi:MAG: DUF294 nucleotidyltransferase-like domain-containing protein [Anaerolineae bacterium]